MNRSTALPRGPYLAVAALAVAAALAAATVAVPAAATADVARSSVTRMSEEIAPGLVLERIVDESIPRRIFVLRFDPAAGRTTLDMALAQPRMPVMATLAEIAQRHDAIAAINGDFGTTGPGRPVHPFAVDGDLIQTSLQNVAMFALSRDGKRGYVGESVPHVSISTPGGLFVIDRWNRGAPMEGEIAAFSPVAADHDPPVGDVCAVRLMPDGAPKAAKDDGIVRPYEVDALGCSVAAMQRKGGIVVAAQAGSDEAAELLSLAVGSTVKLRWTLGWKGVYDAIGGGPMLLWGGQIVLGACEQSVCVNAPRTGIGVTADGTILLVVVDGRQSGWSIGPSLAEFAQIFLDLGAVRAMNLDGGGSSQMIVNGELVNSPADGARGITNAVLILPGPDPGEVFG